jgi:hypothetical protein
MLDACVGSMSKIVPLLIASLLAGTVLAQSTAEERRAAERAKDERRWAIEKRMGETYPQRRDNPLRAENIRDAEVREIQVAAAKVLPKAIVNISGVVTGCPCEEGPTCSDQVWILATSQNKTYGLLLSKVNGHWTIGVIQHWWLQHEALVARREKFTSYWVYQEALDTLKEKFPACLAPSTARDG